MVSFKVKKKKKRGKKSKHWKTWLAVQFGSKQQWCGHCVFSQNAHCSHLDRKWALVLCWKKVIGHPMHLWYIIHYVSFWNLQLQFILEQLHTTYMLPSACVQFRHGPRQCLFPRPIHYTTVATSFETRFSTNFKIIFKIIFKRVKDFGSTYYKLSILEVWTRNIY